MGEEANRVHVIGVVMTNRYFTSGAKELAKATGTLLWDRDHIIELLREDYPENKNDAAPPRA